MRDPIHPNRPALLLFDVNQTLLDLAPLQASIRTVLPGADSPKLWFTATLQHAMLVAAHGWDVAGAAWAGLQCAFVGREGERPFPLAPTPTLEVPDLLALAGKLGA